MNCHASFVNEVSNGQYFQYVVVYNFTTIHAMSHRYYFCVACSSRVNIWETALYIILTLHLTVSQIKLHSFQSQIAMSGSQSLNTSLLEVVMCSKNKHVCICELSDLGLQIISDTWWASINVGLKYSMAWNKTRHGPLWWFYLHCGIEENCSPGVRYIICHQVLRHPSEHGTSSMGNQLLENAQIAKLKELTELEISELTGTAVD